MRSATPRVAYLPDTFYEINGVAHTSRHFEAFAQRRGLPFFCLHPAKRETAVGEQQQGELTTLEIPRGSPISFRLEKDLTFDAAFVRHKKFLEDRLRAFRPDIIHVTGPSEPGILGAWLAKNLKIPLVASWHTNLHEYAAQRSGWFLRVLPKSNRVVAGKKIEDAALLACARFYRLAEVLFAPNIDLCQLLERVTDRHCALMPRGVDTISFSPEYRDRSGMEDAFVLGFCGRLSIEKNVFLLARIRTDPNGAWNHEFSLSHCWAWQGRRLVATTLAERRVHRCASRARPGARLREYGFICVPFPHGYFWQCRVGGAGFRSSGDCHAGWGPACILCAMVRLVRLPRMMAFRLQLRGLFSIRSFMRRCGLRRRCMRSRRHMGIRLKF